MCGADGEGRALRVAGSTLPTHHPHLRTQPGLQGEDSDGDSDGDGDGDRDRDRDSGRTIRSINTYHMKTNKYKYIHYLQFLNHNYDKNYRIAKCSNSDSAFFNSHSVLNHLDLALFCKTLQILLCSHRNTKLWVYWVF